MIFTAIDFETANFNRDSACAVGVVRVENNKIVAKEYSLINPQTHFLGFFTESVHGISEEDVADAPLFPEVWGELSYLLEDIDFIAAHNAPFDKSVLNACCESHGLIMLPHDFVCTVKVAKGCWGLDSATLDKVCDYLGIELNHHEALSDARACATILIRACEDGYKLKF